MASYRRNMTVDLTFGPEDGDLDGLKMTISRLSTREALRLENLRDVKREDLENNQEAQRALMNELLTFVAERTRDWNLEDEDGQPVPVSVDALWDYDMPFWMGIVTKWQDTIVGVAPPLSLRSSGGEPSPLESLPMEVL
jgi:hypothetical protein